MKAYDFSSGITMKFILGVIVTMIVFLPIIITVLIKRKRNVLTKYTSGLALYLSSAHLGIGLFGSSRRISFYCNRNLCTGMGS